MVNTEREALWHRRVAQWQASGLSRRAFALREGHPIRQVGYWVRRLAPATTPLALLPVAVGRAPVVAAGISLRGPGGWNVALPRDVTPDWLATLLRAPCDGTAYVFSNRRRTRLKLVCWDGNGVWMCLRRLHRGQFVWPQAHETSWRLSDAQWQWLIAGVDWRRLSAPAQWRL